MKFDRYLFYFLSLGVFWGLSPSLYRFMGQDGVPVTHIIVYTGLAVGIALWVVAWLVTRRVDVSREVILFGLGCAVLMNFPFGLGLLFARHVPATELALIMSTAPFFNYLVALVTGRETAAKQRIFAIGLGFLSSAVLILSREGMLSGEVSWWTIAAFSGPIMYSGYNWFAARHWPEGRDTMSVGASESIWSGLTVVPLLLVFAPPWASDTPSVWAYWSVGIATAMWIVERIAFFTLIRDRGAVYTIQAVYVATPAAVLWAILFFGGGADIWLWVSLALLMLALWLNNTSRAAIV